MAILVTNDDGDSVGLRALLRVAKKFDSAYAITPNRQRSAIGCALTLHKPIRLHEIDKKERIYSINGTPADCTIFAIDSGEFDKPALVLSGINWGDNTAVSTLLGSGTIGACWQAAIQSTGAIAFSIYRKGRDWRDPTKWESISELERSVESVIKKLIPLVKAGTIFIVNLPENPKGAKIIFSKKMQMRRHLTRMAKRLDPDGVPYFWIHGEDAKTHPETDFEQVARGNIVISTVSLDSLTLRDQKRL